MTRTPLAIASRSLRTVKGLAHDSSIPRWLRVTIIVSSLPIPGPVDNVVQIICASILFTCYRDRVISHYRTQVALDAIIPLEHMGWN